MKLFELKLSEEKSIIIEYMNISIDECYIFLFDTGERLFIPFKRYEIYINNGKLKRVN